MPLGVGITPILVHARRLFTHRTGAGPCTPRTSSRHRTSTVVASSRWHRSKRSCIADCCRSHAGPYDGNLQRPGTHPDSRFRHPQHSSAWIHSPPVVGSRTCTFKRITGRCGPLIHVFARRIFAGSLQCLPSPQQRLRPADSCHLTSGPRTDHTIAELRPHC